MLLVLTPEVYFRGMGYPFFATPKLGKWDSRWEPQEFHKERNPRLFVPWEVYGVSVGSPFDSDSGFTP